MSKRSIVLAAVSLSALATAAAQAQPASPPPAPEVDEVVVTAAPFGVEEDQLTTNVDVLTRDELDLSAPAGLGDALSGLPGVRSTFFGPGSSRPVVRGLAGPRVQVLTNGVGLIDASALSPDHQVAVDPLEATRIEVLRGPAVLAYGGSAIGGVVNIIDERIAETPATGGVDGRVAGSLSSVDDGHAVAAFAKVGGGPLVLTLDAINRESDDYRVPVAPESRRLAESEGEEPEDAERVENSFVELDQIGAGLSYVTGRGFLGVSVKRTESRYGVVGHSHEHGHEHEDEEHDGEAHEGEDEEEPPVTIDLEQTRVDLRGQLDAGFGPFASTRLSAGYADYEHVELEGVEVGTRFLSEGLEGRLELVQQERNGWNGAVGVQALTRDFDAIGEEAYVGRTDISEIGLFTVQRVDRDTHGFEGGLRVDRRSLDNVAFGEREFTNWSASAGAFVRPSEGLFLGLSAARNERAPDEAELFANGVHVATGQAEFGGAAQGREFDSEVAFSLEGTAHFSRGRFDADAHLFLVRYDGFIDLRPTGELFGDEHEEEEEEHEGEDEAHDHEGEDGHDHGGVPVFNYVQTDAEFYGFELEAGYDVFEQGGRKVRLEGAADYVRGDTDLGAPARIPPWSVTGRVVYAGEVIDARLEARRVGEQDRVAQFELPTDGYTLVNAFFAVRPFGRAAEGVTLFAEARNLTDEEAREHASFLKDLAPLPGRNFRAGVAVRF